MTEISLDLVKELRTKTGVSIMQCKKALEEAEGDMEKALINLTKKSGEIAAKKGDREFGAGTIAIADNVMVEFACETDFVANNEEFQEVAKKLATMTANGTTEEEVAAVCAEATQKFGERTSLLRSHTFAEGSGSYVHSNKTIGSVVEFEGEVAADLAKGLAMHVAAQNPRYMKREDITEEEMAKAKEVLAEEVADKPAEMQEKILEGKIASYFKERVFLEQGYIMDPSQTIGQIIGDAQVSAFVRYGVGEE